MALARRTLGSGEQALSVSAQGFGCMGMTANYGECAVRKGWGAAGWPACCPGGLGKGLRGPWLSAGEPMADDAAVELMKAVYGAGVTFWDTAEVSACVCTGPRYPELVHSRDISCLPAAASGLQLQAAGRQHQV